MSSTPHVLLAIVLLASLQAAAQAPANLATETEGDAIEVIATTPVPGLGTQLREIPTTLQSVRAEDLRRGGGRGLADHLEQNFAGVSANATQGNPFQPDLQYRGFTASPLLGTPQGISVFVDGVRVNEAFGDMVNWDLIPRNAIATAHLMSGSNPVFGLNTLGGALAIQTKSGFAFPGSAGRIGAGAFGRRGVEVEHGGHGERADYFLAASAQDETGWREHSSSRIRQAFLKSGWQDSRTDIDLSLALADNALEGVQTTPLGMLAESRRQIYTWPDRTENSLGFATLRASRYMQNDVLLSGDAYLRGFRQANVSSNVNGDFDPLLSAGPGNPQAFNDRGSLSQRMSGAAFQVTVDGEVAGAFNRFTAGAALDVATARFSQDRQEAAFTVDRGTVAAGDFGPRVRMVGNTSYRGGYFIDQLAFHPDWLLTLSGRYAVAKVSLRDRSGTQPALDGDHAFRRFNPAAGINWNPSKAATYFASYSEGMRVPTPVELTCADPAAPCSLPNQFLADPPLKPVIARTLELGARLRLSEKARLSASMYRSTLANDILFVSSGAAVNAGFFQNAGSTLRQGFDLGARAEAGDVSVNASYSRVQAIYLSPFTMSSPNNSSSDPAGLIQVQRGDRLPGIPPNSVKLLADWRVTARFTAALGWNWYGKQFARGDENNRDAGGALPAYAVARLSARYALREGWELSAHVDNLFDRRYENFGVLGRNFFNGPGRGFDATLAAPEQFRSPGAPRAIWIALRYEDKPR